MKFTISAIVALLMAGALSAQTAKDVLIVANKNVETSREVADYYAEMRGIPTDNILEISASEKEEITRDEYNKDIAAPIKKFLDEHANVFVIVPCYGVPMKVKETDRSNDKSVKEGFIPGRDFCSVDGELSLLRHPEEYDIEGAVQNPTYDSADQVTAESNLMIVSRLDGPTPEIAKGLVEKAVLAEALGVYGQSFLDTRNIQKENGYKIRDDIMENVGEVWKEHGVPFDHDELPAVLDLSTRTETLHYYGWYAGTQNPKGKVKFRTGGVCVHLHSFSAGTIRNTKKNWVSKLLDWNATATYGTVYEPLTVGFPYENVFWDRLCKGWSFGQAGLCANRLLSWEAIFVGDPLYHPYAEGAKDNFPKYAQALVDTLVPADEPKAVDTTDLPLFDSALKILQSRAEGVEAALKGKPSDAMLLFDDLRFLISGMGLDAWLKALSEPFERVLRGRIKDMAKRLLDDLGDTEELEQAMTSWKGLSVYEDLQRVYDEVVERQEKDAAKALKKAKRYDKPRKYLKAWMEASEGARMRLCESGKEAKKLQEGWLADADIRAELEADANDELRRDREKVEKELSRKKYDRALKAMPDELWKYPPCEEKALLEGFLAEIEKSTKK